MARPERERERETKRDQSWMKVRRLSCFVDIFEEIRPKT